VAVVTALNKAAHINSGPIELDILKRLLDPHGEFFFWLAKPARPIGSYYKSRLGVVEASKCDLLLKRPGPIIPR
jgi:hypothetical protein